MAFFLSFEHNIHQLQKELLYQTYRPGPYNSFRMYRPKPRLISAAPFRDRVVHHALINVIGPLFERSFVFDCYANRKGKGTHKAIRRCQSYMRRYAYGLKCDIKKYFPTIDHEILKALVRRRIADPKVLWLIDQIIDGSNPQDPICDYFPGDDLLTPATRRRGLPIGNLTSQFFANVYLTPLDHFIKEQLHCKGYVRYVDDFVLFSDAKYQLRQWKGQIVKFLEEYRLKLNPTRVQIFPSSTGLRFLGQLVYCRHRRLPGENVRRFRRRMRKWQSDPPKNLEQRIASWVGHAQQADTGGLLKSFDNRRIDDLRTKHSERKKTAL